MDASHLVHRDMKGHTEGLLTMGSGGIFNKSVKHKLNSKSSTEKELIGGDDILSDYL